MRYLLWCGALCGLVVGFAGCSGGGSDTSTTASADTGGGAPPPPGAESSGGTGAPPGYGPSAEAAGSGDTAVPAETSGGSTAPAGFPGYGPQSGPSGTGGPPPGYGPSSGNQSQAPVGDAQATTPSSDPTASADAAAAGGGSQPGTAGAAVTSVNLGGTADGGAADAGTQPPAGDPTAPTQFDGGPAGDVPTGPEGFTGDGSPAPARPLTLREQAMVKFVEDKPDEAYQLMTAHYLLTPQGGAELAKEMKWVPGLKRPAIGTRLGVVITLIQPYGWEGDPQAIGSQELADAMLESENRNTSSSGGEGGRAGPPRSGRGGFAGAGMQAAPPGARPGGFAANQDAGGTAAKQELMKFTGEFGSKLLDALKKKLEDGTFGEMLKQANRAKNTVPAQDPNNPGSIPGQFGGGDGGQEGEAVTGQLLPGVVFLGVAPPKEVELLTENAPVDVILDFEVTLRPATAITLVSNTTKLRIKTVKDNKIVFTSAGLNNKKVMDDRKTNLRGENPVKKEVDKAMEALVSAEKGFVMQPLPEAVTAERAKARIDSLLAELRKEAKEDEVKDPMPVLLEARYYVAKGLLKPEDLMTVALVAAEDPSFAETVQSLGGAELTSLLEQALNAPAAGAGGGGDLIGQVGGLLDSFFSGKAKGGNAQQPQQGQPQQGQSQQGRTGPPRDGASGPPPGYGGQGGNPGQPRPGGQFGPSPAGSTGGPPAGYGPQGGGAPAGLRPSPQQGAAPPR